MTKRSILGVAVLLATTAGTTLVGSGATVSAEAPPDGTVFINEIHYDNVGTDSGEAIEVAGPAGTDLAGWSVVLYNGSGGAVYDTDVLAGVLADQGGGFGTTSIAYPANGVQNGAPDGVALVDNCGVVVQFLSYEGTFTAAGGPADGLLSTDIGAAQSGSGPIGESLGLAGTGNSYGEFTWGPGVASFGDVNAGQTFDGPVDPIDTTCPPPPGGCPAPPEVSPIGDVQGPGETSPCDGDTVTVEGIVVGDYEGPAPTLRGFYVQQADGSHDDDPATSEGIFVFHGSEDTVNLGDRVSVTAAVAEFQGQTQLGFPDQLTVLESAVAVTPTDVTLPLPEGDSLEAVEGMLVHAPQELTVTEHFQLGRFGQIVVSSGDRLTQPTQAVEPGAEAIALQASNNLNRLIVDDALNTQNRDPIVFGRGGQPLSASNTLRGGDTMTGAVGVLTYTWAGNAASGNAYRLRVEGDLADAGLVPGGTQAIPAFAAVNERPGGPDEVGGSLRIANLNVLNYFLTLDADDNQCGPVGFEQDCRGAESNIELSRQRDKLLAAIGKLDADIIGLAELENTPGVEPMADIVAGLNAVPGGGTYGYVDTGVIGTDAIKVGIIYRADVVAPVGDFAVLDSSVDARFDDDRNRPSLAQSFTELSTGEALTVVANHFKSKSCTDAMGGDADQGDGQACWNPTRVAAAEALVDWLASHPTGVIDDDVQILGDLNSYAKEDPIDVLVTAGYVDLGQTTEDGYSFVFDGQWGSLDFSLSSPSLLSQLTGAAEYHINSDEPNVLDYNTNFKTPGQIESLYAPDEFRVSDHDPIIAGFTLDSQMADSRVIPKRIWPPNHRLRRVKASAPDATVSIVAGTSSEADSGLGPDDRPNDILIDGDFSASVRAERFSKQGRTYTLDLVVTNGTQTRYDTATVRVPHDRRDP
jgi:predicted extracellular nuclease